MTDMYNQSYNLSLSANGVSLPTQAQAFVVIEFIAKGGVVTDTST
jgi:hypothetical protein